LNNGFRLKEAAFSTGAVKKSMAKPLETQDHCAFELFAPELIHESRNCSNVYTAGAGFFQERRYSCSTMSSKKL
jgi:hypothetical protein